MDDKPPKSAVPYQGLDADHLQALAGSQCDVFPWTGKPFKHAELVQLVPGKQPGTLKSISFNPEGGGNKRTLQAKVLGRLIVGTRVHEVVPARGQKNAFLLIDTTSRDLQVSAKLKADGQKLWPVPSAAEREDAIEKNKRLLKKADDGVAGHPFKLTETKHFLVYSDLPEANVTPIGTALEKAYSTIGQKLGVSEDENIFRGKTMVALFSTQNSLEGFANRTTTWHDLGGAEAFGHALPNGDYQIAGYVGDDPGEATTDMVRYAAEAFLEHYRSDVALPKWIGEGFAQWISASVLPGNKDMQRRQRGAADALRESPHLVGFFDATDFDAPWKPGAAAALVDILIKTDPQAFRQFILQIKEGVPWREALEYHFGLTPDDLAQRYGAQIGLPDLRP